MTPQRREQLRQEMELQMDAIDATTEERAAVAKDFRQSLATMRERVKQIRLILKGRAPDQPELPMTTRAVATPPPPDDAPPPAPTRFELLDVDLPHGHMFEMGLCKCGEPEPRTCANGYHLIEGGKCARCDASESGAV